MTYPRVDDRSVDASQSWILAAIFAAFLLTGIALWGYSSGDRQQNAGLADSDATTGQSMRPAASPHPADTVVPLH
jgi:hypothetical protein